MSDQSYVYSKFWKKTKTETNIYELPWNDRSMEFVMTQKSISLPINLCVCVSLMCLSAYVNCVLSYGNVKIFTDSNYTFSLSEFEIVNILIIHFIWLVGWCGLRILYFDLNVQIGIFLLTRFHPVVNALYVVLNCFQMFDGIAFVHRYKCNLYSPFKMHGITTHRHLRRRSVLNQNYALNHCTHGIWFNIFCSYNFIRYFNLYVSIFYENIRQFSESSINTWYRYTRINISIHICKLDSQMVCEPEHRYIIVKFERRKRMIGLCLAHFN